MQVTAVEIREDSIRKAKFLHSLRKITNVWYLRDDLDNPQFVSAETYDVIFCVGLLYHLRDPARFLARRLPGGSAPLGVVIGLHRS